MTAPNVAEYVTYLANRIDEQEQMIERLMGAINNLDVRAIIAERAIAAIRHEMENGEKLDESKMKWWN